MNGSIALDTSVVIRYLNGNQDIVDHVLQFSSIILPVNVYKRNLRDLAKKYRNIRNLVSLRNQVSDRSQFSPCLKNP